MNIFISYTIKDKEISIYKLKNISKKLKQIGYVYVDLINNDSVNKQARVFQELDNSNVVILIISPNIYQSQWVLKELERAKEKSIPIIPLTIKEIEKTDISILNQYVRSVSSMS